MATVREANRDCIAAEAEAPLRLLVVDDDERFRACIAALLAGDHWVEIVGEAGDGDEAIHAAAALAPDTILLDIDMPRMDGLSAARVLARLACKPAIVVLTGALSRDRERDATTAGACAVLAKGDVERLQETLARLRRERPGSLQPPPRRPAASAVISLAPGG